MSDVRFSNKEALLLKNTKFPIIYKQSVDMARVNRDVMKMWISNKILELLQFEDDVLIEYVFTLLEQESVDPRVLQINLTGFLEEKAVLFVKELWKLLLDAQNGTLFLYWVTQLLVVSLQKSWRKRKQN